MDYPDEPWDLHGHGYISLWLVPSRELPSLPPEVTPISLLGKAVVATAFVDYLPGSLLPYHELLAAVVVRQGLRPGLTITDIWVDSPSSRAGGRELWGIPKELAEFKLVHEPTFTGTASDSSLLAEAGVRPATRGLPLPFPVTGTVLQTLRGELARTPVRASGRIRWAKGIWRTSGALGWLAGHRPFATVKAEEFKLRFGPKS
ncbi:acetoacetate decarboxylase family protein [Amycolatopsis sp.]|uniref:acetoacetate decarboxylase family protein n=1 Tax=Amycolatopsis sp. TaxID=37632 RepID=UPI002CA569F8|nr:acetoacetate decarboxylase family protein [Amycolatopsis sp.]HVV13935.1 acetoacetate decarboxylase family protein [Amycolatopsis sp.]